MIHVCSEMTYTTVVAMRGVTHHTIITERGCGDAEHGPSEYD